MQQSGQKSSNILDSDIVETSGFLFSELRQLEFLNE